jgi:hypothetical protein
VFVSIDRQLVAEMVQDLVGWCSEAASVGESEMGCDEKVWQVFGEYFASDLVMVAGGVGVF